MVQSHQVKHGGVQVVNVNAILNGGESKLVRRAVGQSAFDPATGEPGSEAVVIVVAAVGSLRGGRAAELAAADDQRLVEQAALLEVLEERCDRLIDDLR